MAIFFGTNGNDTLFGTDGNDDLFGADGDDILQGLGGNDALHGDAGKDILFGGDGNDTLNGGTGDDLFFDPDGINLLNGGDGNDTFLVNVAVGGANTATGGAGQDLYFLDPESPSLASGTSGQAYVITDFEVGGGGDQLIVVGLLSPGQGYTGGDPRALGFLNFVQSGANTRVEWDRDGAAGSAFGSILVATLTNVTATNITDNNLLGLFFGTEGDDVLEGGSDDDAIFGGGGNDTLSGGGGNDVLDGGPGADRMVGGSGNDTYFVDELNDEVVETSNTPVDDGLGLAAAGLQNALEGITDTVVAAINYSLSNVAFVENLTLNAVGTARVATGNALDNVLTGNALNNTLTGLAGNDTIDGGGGVDTAIYSGKRSDHTIAKAAAGYTVSGPEGLDAVSNVERLQFSDKGLAFDFGTSEAAGNTVRVIGAAFDAPAIQQHPDWVGLGLNFFDSGMSMLAVCELVVPLMGLSNTDFVTSVYTNVVGAAPSPADRDYFVGLLQGSGGAMTQAELLVLAANTEFNATNIDLAGLQNTGVEFV